MDLRDELTELLPQLSELSVRAFAENLTEQELRDYLAWEESPTGRSILQKLPAIRTQVMHDELPLLSNMLPKLVERTADRVCEQHQCSHAEHDQIVALLSKALNVRPT